MTVRPYVGSKSPPGTGVVVVVVVALLPVVVVLLLLLLLLRNLRSPGYSF